MNKIQSNGRTLLAALVLSSLPVGMFVAAGSQPAFAQVNVVVKGKVTGPDGQPMQNAKVQLTNTENGRKFEMKTNKKGEYMNIGVAPGTYNAVLVGPDGKELDKAENFKADFNAADGNVLDFNLQQRQQQQSALATGQATPAQVAQQNGQQAPKMTEEQKKQLEEVQKKNAEAQAYNAKVGNLNQLLTAARADIQAKNYPDAIAKMNQGIQMDPNQPLLYGTLGDAQNGAKDYPGCVQSFTKAVELQNAKKPNPAITSRWESTLGICQIRAGQIDAGKASFDKAAQEDPTFAATAYYNEGAMLTNVGKNDDANAAFDKAIAADPNRADAYYQKGVNLLAKATVDKSGKPVPVPGTAEAFQKYLELAPNGPMAPTAQQMLESLGEKVQTNYKAGKKK